MRSGSKPPEPAGSGSPNPHDPPHPHHLPKPRQPERLNGQRVMTVSAARRLIMGLWFGQGLGIDTSSLGTTTRDSWPVLSIAMPSVRDHHEEPAAGQLRRL
jgi:hypothetical protein